MEQNFAKLFRHSKFAAWNPTLQKAVVTTPRLANSYGLKRTMRLKKEPQCLQVDKLDDYEYHVTTFQDTSSMLNRRKVMEELVSKIDKKKSEPFEDFFGARGLEEIKIEPKKIDEDDKHKETIIGRVLNRCEGGYAIGVGGIVAFLPYSEVYPRNIITAGHVIHKKPMRFFVRVAKMYTNGSTRIVLSTRHE